MGLALTRYVDYYRPVACWRKTTLCLGVPEERDGLLVKYSNLLRCLQKSAVDMCVHLQVRAHPARCVELTVSRAVRVRHVQQRTMPPCVRETAPYPCPQRTQCRKVPRMWQPQVLQTEQPA